MPAIETERVVDVRPLEDPPFDAILTALGDLAAEPVVVIDSTEPTALFEALAGRDLSSRMTRRDGDWHVHISADNRRETERDPRSDRPRTDSIIELTNPELL